MNIFFRELRAYRISTIIWTISLSLLVITFLSIYPIFIKDVETTKKILENLPPVVAAAIGLSINSLLSIYGFVSFLLTFITVAGSVQAMSLGVGILSKEESGKTADFLLSRPISRTKVITQKLLAITTLIVMTNIIFAVTAFATVAIVSTTDFNIGTFFLLISKLILIQLIFFAVGFLLSVLIPKIKSAIAITLPTVFSLFFIGTLTEVLHLDALKYISPFKFFDSNYIIANNALDPKFLIIEAVIIIVSITTSYLIYIKKDIRAAA